MSHARRSTTTPLGRRACRSTHTLCATTGASSMCTATKAACVTAVPLLAGAAAVFAPAPSNLPPGAPAPPARPPPRPPPGGPRQDQLALGLFVINAPAIARVPHHQALGQLL